MSSICSWKPRARLSVLGLSFIATFTALCLTPAMADPVRLGDDFSDLVGYEMSDFGTVARVLGRADLAAQAWAVGAANCRELVDIPTEKEKDYIFGGDPWFSLRSARVECWAVLQLDPKANVETTKKGDGITRELILDILEHVLPPSEEKDIWVALASKSQFETLFRRSQDDATLWSRNGQWLHGDWKIFEAQMRFQVLAAFSTDRIISVHQRVEGGPEMLFGVRWRKTESGGEVVEVFPDIDRH